MDIAVIIPSYNGARFIPSVLPSVLCQTSPAQEVIVVDDGSTDDTQDVLANFAGTVLTIRQDNRGLSGARNTGARTATTEWLAFLDADDLYEPRFLERVRDLQKAFPNVGAIFTDYSEFGDGGQTLASNMDFNIPDVRSLAVECDGDFLVLAPEHFSIVIERNGAFAPSCVVVRRSVFERANGFHEGFGRLGAEDLDFWMRALPAERIAIVKEPLARKRHHRNNMSWNYGSMRAGCELALSRAEALYCERFPHLLPVVRRKRSGLRCSWGRHLCQLNRYNEALRTYGESIKDTPWRLTPWIGLAAATVGLALNPFVGRPSGQKE